MSWEDDYEDMCNLIVPVHESVPVFHESEKKMKKKKVLIIDDNKDFLDAVGSCCGEVICAECHSVKAAIMAIEANKPDVVFLDHSLTENGNEGFVVLEYIKEHAPSTKVYATTSNTDAAKKYLQKGIKIVDKTSIAAFAEIIGDC